MPRKKDSSRHQDALRRKAEKQARATRSQIKQMSTEEIQRLVHELQIHQIELDLQNEDLRRAHLDLEEAHDPFQELYEWAPVGYAVLNARATIVQANLRLSEILGVERKHLTRRRFKEFIAYTDQSRFTRYWRDAMASHSTTLCEVRLLPACPAQTVILKSQPVQKQGGKAAHCLVAVIDMTAEKALQQSVEREQARLNGIVASVMDAIITVDKNHKIILFNAAAERMFHCSATKAIGQPIDQFIPERFRETHREAMRQFAESHSPSRHMGAPRQVLGLRSDGEEISLEASISQIEVGGEIFMTVVHRDITERLQMEQALKSERDFISAVLDTAGALVIVLDPDGRIVRFNRACERTTGYKAEEVLFRRIWDLFPTPEESEPAKAFFEQLRTTKTASSYENYWRTRAGNLRWIAWSNTVLLDTCGEVQYVIGIGIDQTDKKQVDEALKAHERMLQHNQDQLRALSNRLITVAESERTLIARELHDDASQRLAAILLDLSLLQDTPSLSATDREALRSLQTRISSLSDDIHALSYTLHPKILDDLGLVAATRSLIAGFAHGQHPTIRFVTRAVPREVPSQIALCCYRVIQQGLDNSVKHAQASQINVTIAGFRAKLGICIADNGRGFDPDQDIGRPSLGLLSMRERALALSGNLRVRSSPGQGTHIHLQVPLHETQPFQEESP